jgi:hypothetical protein
MSSSQGRFTGPDPANAGADIGNPQSWNGYSYVLNKPLRVIDPSGMASCYVDGFQTDCSVAQHMSEIGTASQCPNDQCTTYNYDQNQFQQFVAGAGGASGYVNFSELGQLNEWQGKLYTNDQFQKQVIQPAVDSQHVALAKLISSITGKDYQSVYDSLAPAKVAGSNVNFTPDPNLDLSFLQDPALSRNLRTNGAPSAHEHLSGPNAGLIHMDTMSPYSGYGLGLLVHFFVDVAMGNINGGVPYFR